MIKKRVLPIIISILLGIAVVAQPTFTDQSTLLPNPDVHNGIALAVTDMNGDFLDDMVHLDNAQNLMIELQQLNGSFITINAGQVSNQNQWSLCVADVDENGFGDVISGGSYDGIQMALANNDGTAFTISDLPDGVIYTQGSCFGDFNNDGSIDYFACHDDAESRIWLNDGTGNFTPSGIIDFDISPSDDSGNYGVIWTDFDTDGDLDIYIAKCRQGIDEPTDPRRINVLFENDGNNNYTENAEAHGLKITAQSWTADFGDYDNDGDFDCFITNHDTGNMLLNNDNGLFSNVSGASGISGSAFPLQGVFTDFDNDGHLDILLSGALHELYHNDGDGTFTKITDFLNDDEMTSFALGDLNHDGFVDIYASYNLIYDSPSTITDKVWINNGNDNNFIGVNVKGTISNINGIGAKIYAYGPWGVKLREVRAGQSYGIMNSTSHSIGIGTSQQVDSIYVEWPSGIVDKVYDPDPNQYITIIENECINISTGVTADGPLVFCSGDDVTLTADEGISYLWSTNDTTQSITVTEAGFYSVIIYETPNCWGVSATIEVIVDPVELPTIEVMGETEFCFGEELVLTSSDANSWEWNNGLTDQSITVTESGDYYVTIQGVCVEANSDTISVSVYEVNEPVTTGDFVNIEGVVNLESTGENPQWYDQEIDGNLVNTGNTYDPYLTETTSFWVSDIVQQAADSINGGKEDFSGFGGENSPVNNGHLLFNAYQDFELYSVKVLAFGDAERTIEHRLSDGTVLDSKTVFIPDGESTIELNFDIDAGFFYELGCSSDPSLYRNNGAGQQDFPYLIGDACEIITTSEGPNFYYYFYDWKIVVSGFPCESDRVEVIGEVIPSSVNDVLEKSISIYPNPTTGLLNIDPSEFNTNRFDLELVDVVGKTVFQKRILDFSSIIQVDMSDHEDGIYLLKIISESAELTRKVIKR